MKNMIREEQELLVKQLGIFELRGLARELGIPSPTTKKRDELIKLILLKFENGDIVDDKGKRKGRPCKKLSTINDIVSTIANQFNEKNAQPLVFETLVTFAQVLPTYEKNIKEDENILSSGIVRINDQHKQFYDRVLQGWIFIDDKTQYADLLQSGDKVKIICNSTENKVQYIAKKILEINEIPAEQYRDDSFVKGDEIISQRFVPYAGGKVYEGRRNSILHKNDIYENDDFKNLTEECINKNIKLVVLGINTSFENQIYFKNLKFENFTTKYGALNEANFNCIIDSIQYVQNLSNRGKNVIFYILDAFEVMRVLDKCFIQEGEEDGHKKPSIVILKKILSLGMAYQKGGSISVVVGYSPNDKNDKFLNNDILKVSKDII